jgi:cold shock CspA family protein
MANRRYTDTILYCERCGISFLWNVEEQRAAGALPPRNSASDEDTPNPDGPNSDGLSPDGMNADEAHVGAAPSRAPDPAGPSHSGGPATQPRLCPGCRALQPPAGRERGLVKWYSMRKRFGFVVRRSEEEIFLPGSALVDRRVPQTGDLVEFSVGESEKGPVAQQVRIIATAAEIDQPLEEPAPARRRSVAARTRRV